MATGVLHKFEPPNEKAKQTEEFRRILEGLSDEDLALLEEYIRVCLRRQELWRRMILE